MNKKMVDRQYCMNSFLMFRTIVDRNKAFAEDIKDYHVFPPEKRRPVSDSFELEAALRDEMARAVESGKCALALSGGIDSAILAKMMPKGSVAYTFKCVVPGISVVDETPMAARYAEECGLKHRIVEVYWEDMEAMAPILMRHKGAPCHSIEIQIFKASKVAMSEGMDSIVFGESADIVYGGMSGLLSKDWLLGDFVERYSYIMPHKALRNPQLIMEPYLECEKDGYADVHGFLNKTMYEEAINSYSDACATAGIKLYMPYSKTVMSAPLDYERIRRGENKYLIREIFERLYPGWEIPVKTPMPRPLNEWFKNWQGPTREDFLPHCVENMTGDQKWYVYALETFLNMIDNNEYNKL